MAKLQPNFSWQKYEGKPEDQREQFQYQLQQQHIAVANSVNATINDESFFTAERQTSFTWIDGQPIWTLTLATASWTSGGTVNTIPLTIAPLKNDVLKVISIEGYVSNGTTFSSNTLVLPYVDAVTGANSIGMLCTGANIVLTSGGTDYSAYSGYVTVYYLKN
jgi:hypothetical protein